MKTTLAIAAIFCISLSFGQSANRDQLIALAKTYGDYIFMNVPSKKTVSALRADAPADLKTTANFVAESITTKNKLLTPAYLRLPDDAALKQLYIIWQIYANNTSDAPQPNEPLTDSLMGVSVPRYELVDNYYLLLFRSCGNKNQPFNLSKTDFDLAAYGLRDDTEKGIFFLECMDYCGTMIWGYMNIPKPANTKEALSLIKKYPKFNGQPYYAFDDFFFPDFEMVILDQGVREYKSYYLNKYFETLLSHALCLYQEKAPQEEMQLLLLGSIMRDERLYKYTEYKETLEEIFSEAE
jgi:hypothetical protein